MPVPVDSLEVHILVDNTVDSLSSVPAGIEAEWPYQVRRGHEVSSDVLCCAVHGLACLVTVRRDGVARSLLFDAGPEGYAFERNTTRLGIDLGAVEAVVLSHGHWDHACGLPAALDLIRAANGEKPVPLYVHPGMFAQRGSKRADGSLRILEDIPSPVTLAAHGAVVIDATEPQELLDGMVHLTGEIPRVVPFEKGLPGDLRRNAEGEWEPDPLITDERFLTVNVAGKGIVVLTACSHAGIVNVLKHAREIHPDVPLHGVVGGLHLAGTNERIIPQTVEALRDFDLARIAAGHCTGWRAIDALVETFGKATVSPLAAGKRYLF
ncbi:MBL fold metallo-hydrolase [Rhodovulum sp. PH10]|uniref:MBL fold metallo-hydrolase n=1 Tax=Rhodovulum sp. PH10 TaxID=1187851 RepID=UPI00058D57C5|nr:MBL fold metallo-hydrolase [Rhodovulum sp. PH10]